MPNYKILKNKEDFEWHKRKLDAEREVLFTHRYKPEKYPCGVKSEYFDDPDGDWGYIHSFYYQQEVTCSECGHKTLVWPEEID